MSNLINVYCDESGHLEKSEESVMVLGAVWCPQNKAREIAKDLRQLKINNGLSSSWESKWTKVSPRKQEYYLEVIDYFFKSRELQFRGIVVPDKSVLNHDDFGQTHDDWYYKMYFTLLTRVIDPEKRFRVYLDVKDTRSSEKTEKLHEVLSNAKYDFDRHIVERIQVVRSHEVEQIQLADLLIGAIAYANRELNTSEGKKGVVQRVRDLSGYSLVRTTLLKEKKFNLLVWEPAPGE